VRSFKSRGNKKKHRGLHSQIAILPEKHVSVNIFSFSIIILLIPKFLQPLFLNPKIKEGRIYPALLTVVKESSLNYGAGS